MSVLMYKQVLFQLQVYLIIKKMCISMSSLDFEFTKSNLQTKFITFEFKSTEIIFKNEKVTYIYN